MRLDRPKEQIEQELLVQARDTWGAERVEALRHIIGDAAGWISLIGRYKLGIHEEEPDYLVAPEPNREAR